MENHPKQATPVINREMERRLDGLYKRGDAGAVRWMVRMMASQLPPTPISLRELAALR